MDLIVSYFLMPKFKHYPIRPKRLTSAFAKAEYAKLLKRLPAAEASKDAKAWLKLFADWNALKSYIGSEGARINHRFNQDMRSKKAETAEIYFHEKVVPITEKPEHELTQAFLASQHKKELAKKYGSQLVPIYKTFLNPLNPINANLRIQDNRLVKQYEKLLASGTVKVKGQKMTLSKAGSLTTSGDPALRKAAFLAIGDWFLAHHAKMSRIYAKLVKIRNQMGKNVGLKSFTPLAYQNMGRTDYDEESVKKFRKAVLKYAVPLRQKLVKQHTEALGTPTLAVWDAGFNPQLTLPLGIVPVDKQLAGAQKLFNKLHPQLARNFKSLRKRKLIDLEDRPGKRNGAYCTVFTDEETVALLCDSTGDSDDIRVLTHEMGHAFQMMASQKISSVDLQVGTAELAEIESMGMEFLSLPHIDAFFNPLDAKKIVITCWLRAISTLCYVCVVDEFQHWVYANPQATSGKQDQKWVELADTYMPGLDWRGVEKYRKTGRVNKHHIFTVPFYYIDYALAEVCAMQLALIDAKDHRKALAIYLRLCGLGGTKSFLAAVKDAGLRSPFDEKLMADLVKHAAKILV